MTFHEGKTLLTSRLTSRGSHGPFPPAVGSDSRELEMNLTCRIATHVLRHTDSPHAIDTRQPFPMASLLSLRASRASLLNLPPQLRPSAYHATNTLSRSHPFSSCAPRRAVTPADLIMAGPSLLINSIHALGIPWYATLPLTAILVRGTLVYYLSTLPSRRASTIHAQLIPLTAADTVRHTGQETAEEEDRMRRAGEPAVVRKFKHAITRFWRMNVKMHELGKQFGAPRFHPRGVLNFALLVAFAETIRMKCGVKEGLLPLLLRPIEWVGELFEKYFFGPWPFPEIKPVSEAKSFPEVASRRPEEILAQPLAEAGVARDADFEAVRDVGMIGGSGDGASGMGGGLQQAVESIKPRLELSSASLPDIMSAHFDPSMQTEGLSWCTDLTLPDPTFTLPCVFTLIMAASIILRPRFGQQPPPLTFQDPPPPTSSNPQNHPPLTPQPEPITDQIRNIFTNLNYLQRIGLSITLIFWFAALKMPAAVLLYIAPSIVVGWVQKRYLAVKMPVRPGIQPCRLPLRMKQRKEWTEF